MPEDLEAGSMFFTRLKEALEQLGPAAPPLGMDIPFCGGLIGYLSYDFGTRLERLPETASDDLHLPPAQMGLYDWALVTDHCTRATYVVFHPSATAERQADLCTRLQASAPAKTDFRLRRAFSRVITEGQYRTAIEQIQAYITAGDCYQVNYAQRFSSEYGGDPWYAYQALRSACPTPFSAYLSLGDDQAILSLSPERFIAADSGHVETRPIKGTRPRGVTPEDDRAFADDLLHSEKDRAENLMIVDLLRNDLGRSCAPGTVRVPELFSLESYPNVHHLVSSVQGMLAPDKDVFDLLAGSFPGGSITGAPKIRAMEIIDELEPTCRGPYCGSILYLDVRGRMDSSISIRTLLAWNGQIHCWGGGGIVADSEWRSEYEESITKVRVLLETLSQFVAEPGGSQDTRAANIAPPPCK
ncbi:aminodeoxychorismate synthase, component I [Pseudomonas matsuisoli]|uniref:aminodeoxychorismate synthase n=2 Tax=Pseudomonas matsuisoli TaxID=1515666 RepID=A0A917Q114_9PSED|nr:aminodeoxychorismate synthase, component I [Pseudomonas matsuisoli]